MRMVVQDTARRFFGMVRVLTLTAALTGVLLPSAALAQGVNVLGLQSLEGDDEFARNLTGALRYAVGQIPEWTLAAEEVTLSQMLLVHGCDSPTAVCLGQIANSLGAEKLVYGTVQRSSRGSSYRFQVSLGLFDARTGTTVEQAGSSLASQRTDIDDLRGPARDFAQRLAGRHTVGTLRVVTPVEGATVFVDGHEVGTVEGGEFVLETDPGVRRVRVEAPGYAPHEQQLSISVSQVAVVEARLSGSGGAFADGLGLGDEHEDGVDDPIPDWIHPLLFGLGAAAGVLQVVAWVQAERAGDSAIPLEDDPIIVENTGNPMQGGHACDRARLPLSSANALTGDVRQEVADLCSDSDRWSDVTYALLPISIGLGIAAVTVLVLDLTGALEDDEAPEFALAPWFDPSGGGVTLELSL